MPRGFFVAPDTAEGRAVVSALLGTCAVLAGRGEDECVCWVRGEDAYAANTLQIGEALLMAAGFPRAVRAVEEMLARHAVRDGMSVVQLEMGEFRKANGGKVGASRRKGSLAVLRCAGVPVLGLGGPFGLETDIVWYRLALFFSFFLQL